MSGSERKLLYTADKFYCLSAETRRRHNNMNRMRKDNKGVSPVIATILMVAITVVLAGVLVVYLQTLPSSGGNVETNLGLRVERVSNGDWLISVTGGSQVASAVTLQVLDPNTGAVVATAAGATLASYNFAVFPLTSADGWGALTHSVGTLNNNNGGATVKVDAGDTMVLFGATHAGENGKDLSGMKVQFLKGQSIIGTIGELPS
jgi:flagellin-like protein